MCSYQWIRYLLLVLITLGCGVSGSSALPLRASFEIQSIPTPRSSVAGDPLEYAMDRIGLDFERLQLPKSWESGYRAIGRHPLIEAVASDPNLMVGTGRDLIERLRKSHQQGLASMCRTVQSTLGINRGWQAKATMQSDIRLVRASLKSTALDEDLQEAVVDLFSVYLVCCGVNEMLVTSGSVGRAAKILEDNPAYYLFPQGKIISDPTCDTTDSLKFLDRLRSIDLSIYERMAVALGAAVDRVASFKKRVGKAGFRTMTLKTSIGLVVLAGGGRDQHGPAPFILDFGGDDSYSDGAGSSRLSKKHVALSLDLGGNDSYGNVDQDALLGFGQLGIGLLADIGGNDIYLGGKLSQGVGMFGCGVLWDEEGDDHYTSTWFSQGAGCFGTGLLADRSGDDVYNAVSLSMGSGTTLGTGILSDGSGDDVYIMKAPEGQEKLHRVNIGFGMGGGFSFRNAKYRTNHTAWGGIGVLNDAEGNDRYESPGISVMGGGYVLGFGVMADGQGNDVYKAGTGLGSALHVASGLFVDEAGDDIYHGQFRSGGAGADLSIGVFLELEGNDTYHPGQSCFGASCKRGGISLFIEQSGNDTYNKDDFKNRVLTNSWGSYGAVWPDKAHQSWPYAIHLDLGGEDKYPRSLANNSERAHFGHGLHLDIDDRTKIFDDGPVFEFDNELDSPGADFLGHLKSPNLLHRFLGAGLVLSQDLEGQGKLIKLLSTSKASDFNQDILEALSYGLVRKVWSDDLKEAYANLLETAPDPEVRARVAMDISFFNLNKNYLKLVNYLSKTEDAKGTRMALASLFYGRQLGNADTVSRFLSHMDPDVRRNGLRYMAFVPGQYETIAKIIKTEIHPAVRVAAVEALALQKHEKLNEFLRQLAVSNDIYLRRAAGWQLARRGQIEGLDALISSLDFSSIDTTFNYGDNLYRELSTLTRHRFKGAKQVNPQAWRDWYAKNRNQIDFNNNRLKDRKTTWDH